MSDSRRDIYNKRTDDENNDSATTTTTINSSRAASLLSNNRSTLNIQQQSNNEQQSNFSNRDRSIVRATSSLRTRSNSLQVTTSTPKMNSSNYEIEHLSDDQEEYDYEYTEFDTSVGATTRRSILNDDLDARAIVDYFDESELQPTTADMILDFEPSKAIEINETAAASSSVSNKQPGRTNARNVAKRQQTLVDADPDDQRPATGAQKARSKMSSSPSMRTNSIMKKAPSQSSDLRLVKQKAIVEQSSVSSKLPHQRTVDQTPSSEVDDVFERDHQHNEQHNGKTDPRKELSISAMMLTNRRILQQEQKQAEQEHQRQMKNMSRAELEKRLHQHQFPHPTQQQRMMETQRMKMMYGGGGTGYGGGGGYGAGGGGGGGGGGNSNSYGSGPFNQDLTRRTSEQIKFSDYLDEEKIDVWGRILIGLSYFLLLISFPFSLCTCVKVAQEYERAVIFRLGRILDGGEKGPGIFFLLPCVDTYTKVDLRTVTFDVPPQEILTKDSVTVSVDAVVYFRIFNAVISVINVEDAAKSTKLLAASTLRNILGMKSLHEILSDRESVAILIQNNLDEATEPWGVKVERVEVKDVRLPVQLQRAMATEAEAAREARAKVIAAEGEQKSSKALKEAADVISESPIAIQLRYLQALTQVASEKNSTIVFPIPLEMISYISTKTASLFKSTKRQLTSH